MKLTNVYDSAVPTKNLVTTILGILGLVVSILVGFGLITSDQATELTNQTTVIANAVLAVVGAITALIAIFKAKD